MTAPAMNDGKRGPFGPALGFALKTIAAQAQARMEELVVAEGKFLGYPPDVQANIETNEWMFPATPEEPK